MFLDMKVKLGENTKTNLKKVKIVSRKTVHAFEGTTSGFSVTAEAEQKIVLRRNGKVRVGRYRRMRDSLLCISEDEFVVPEPAAARLMNSIFHCLSTMKRTWSQNDSGTWNIVYSDRKGRKLRDSGHFEESCNGDMEDLNRDIRNVLGIDDLWVFDGRIEENREKVCALQISGRTEPLYLIDEYEKYEEGDTIIIPASTENEGYCAKVAVARFCTPEEMPCPLGKIFRGINELALSLGEQIVNTVDNSKREEGEDILDEKRMRQYAELLVCSGANIQKGQEVEIRAELDQPAFIRMLIEECYRAGAKRVRVDWHDQKIQILDNDFQMEETLSKYEKWETELLQYKASNLVVEIYILSADPDGMKCKDQTKMLRAYNARRKIAKPYRIQTDGKVQWLIAAVPGRDWAKRLFPELAPSEAEARMWDLILQCSYENRDGWDQHIFSLKKYRDYLNSLDIVSLHYTAGNGTDLTVGLIPDSHFCAGDDKTISGISYCANIPTEECFISPLKGAAEGIVYSTKPMSYQGQIIENFSIVFENGKAIKVKAEKNEELLEEIIRTDKGSSYLGECALVPFESPINASGVIFQETLFDENACCHLALGEGFSECLDGFEKMTYDETRQKGINESAIHVDFMIGTADLQITAQCRDGSEIPVFMQGTWAVKGGTNNE